MNKQCYRIIFNAIRGQWMVVQESARGCGKDHSSCANGNSVHEKVLVQKRRVKSLKQVCIALLIGLGGLHSAFAQIVADPNAGAYNQPNVITPPNSNNVPVVNIAPPSSAGVSHNLYDQFNVQQQGVILNNSVINTQTQLGGWIQGNPNLGGGPARVILNEVTSGNPSMLQGYIEVGGRRAEVIIANPAGISVNGGGVINVSGFTLTTGRPQFNQFGSLESFRVGGGKISISGDGLDTSTADYTQLISRAVEVNSGLWANDLRVTAGTGEVGVDATPIRITAEDEDGKPLYAIDVAYLGGMYAGKISLVGTESGVGVHNKGQIGATAGQIMVTADGQLVNSGSINSMGQGSQLVVNTQGGIDNTGTLSSQGNTQLQSAEQITNRGVIDGKDTLVKAQTIDNVGSGRIYGNHLALEADTIRNREESVDGQTQAAVIAARDRLDIGARELNNRENAFIYSAGDMYVGGSLNANRQAQGKADLIQNDGAKIEAGGNMTLSAQQINNTNTNFQWEYEKTPYEGLTWTIGYNNQAYDPKDVKISINGNLYNMPLNANGEPDGAAFWNLIHGNKKQYLALVLPDGNVTVGFYMQYVSSQTLYKPVTVSSQAGEIISGKNMLLDGDLTNDKSRILAGGTVQMTGNTTLNDAEATQYIERTGTWTYFEFEDDHISTSRSGPLHDTISNTKVSMVVATPQNNATGTGSGIQLPGNSFFSVVPGNKGKYLIETDARFANYGNWLTSDYLLKSLGLDPALVQKRLGDGFYEQQLIREQVGQLTGYRYLAGYASDEEQYQGLMSSGAAFGKEYGLTVGVALTAEQMAKLTDDIVWLVSENVTLSDGSVESVLVPKVYARSGTSIVTPDGSLVSGQNVLVSNTNNNPIQLNSNATLAAKNNMVIDVNHVQNNVGQIHAGDLYVKSATDINNIGGSISADKNLTLDAGNNINIGSSVINAYDVNGHRTEIGNVGSVSVTGKNTGGNLVINAGNDVNLNAASVNNLSQGGQTTLAAGNDLNIGTVTTEYYHQRSSSSSSRKHNSVASGSNETGSSIQAAGDLNLVAGNGLNVRGSTLASTDKINATANSINIDAAKNNDNYSQYDRHNSSMGLASVQTTTSSALLNNKVSGSTLSAGEINLNSNEDLTIRGSNVTATGDLNLASNKGDVNIVHGTGERSEYHYQRTDVSGVTGLTPTSITVGKTSNKSTDNLNASYAVSSTVGSTQGNVNISAKGGDYHQVGSDVMASNGNLNVIAQDISVEEARNVTHRVETSKTKQTGLTVGLGGSVVSAMGTVQGMSQLAEGLGTEEAKVKGDIVSGMAVVGAVTQPSVGINVSLGTSKTESKNVTHMDQGRGSNMQANNINLLATGKTDPSTGSAQGGDILVQGSQIKAGQNANLNANNDVNVLGSANTVATSSKSSSSSSSIGATVGVGPTGISGSMNGSVSGSKTNSGSSSTNWTSSSVSAADTLTVNSGANTNVIGGKLAGNTVNITAGDNLNIESLQNKSQAGVMTTEGKVGLNLGGGALSGSVSGTVIGTSGEHSTVNDYSGIMAGDGGFNVNVQNNTGLKGAIIASNQDAVDQGKNQLTTGTLTTNNIDNSSGYQSVGGTISIGVSKDGIKPGLPTVVASSGSSSNVTQSGISDGKITITNSVAQQQTGLTTEQVKKVVQNGTLTGQDANSLKQEWSLAQLQGQTTMQLNLDSAFSATLQGVLDKFKSKDGEK